MREKGFSGGSSVAEAHDIMEDTEAVREQRRRAVRAVAKAILKDLWIQAREYHQGAESQDNRVAG